MSVVLIGEKNSHLLMPFWLFVVLCALGVCDKFGCGTKHTHTYTHQGEVTCACGEKKGEREGKRL